MTHVNEKFGDYLLKMYRRNMQTALKLMKSEVNYLYIIFAGTEPEPGMVGLAPEWLR